MVVLLVQEQGMWVTLVQEHEKGLLQVQGVVKVQDIVHQGDLSGRCWPTYPAYRKKASCHFPGSELLHMVCRDHRPYFGGSRSSHGDGFLYESDILSMNYS